MNTCPSIPSDSSNHRVDQRVEELIHEISGQIGEALRPHPEAIVLTGSFARGEGSAILADNRLRVLGDIEFLVFFESGVKLAKLQGALNLRARSLQKELAARETFCDLEFGAVQADYLRKMRPHIFAYELITSGRTVWGKSDILARAKRFPASALPLWDAWRMLNNRIVEQLESLKSLESRDRAALEHALYSIVKSYIDLATTCLIFCGRYASTYAARSAELRRWAAEPAHHSGAAFLKTLADRVSTSTAFKLSPSTELRPLGIWLDQPDLEKLRAEVRRASLDLVILLREVWRWQAAKLAGLPMDKPREVSELTAAVFQTQGWNEKLRGWAKLAATPEVRQQRGFYRRAGSLLRRASPRYLIYSVASELYFNLPAVFSGSDPDVARLERQLPVVFTEHFSEPRAWWRLRANVITGWRLFLRNHWA